MKSMKSSIQVFKYSSIPVIKYLSIEFTNWLHITHYNITYTLNPFAAVGLYTDR